MAESLAWRWICSIKRLHDVNVAAGGVARVGEAGTGEVFEVARTGVRRFFEGVAGVLGAEEAVDAMSVLLSSASSWSLSSTVAARAAISASC